MSNEEKLAASTAMLRGDSFTRGDVTMFPLNGGGFCVQQMDASRANVTNQVSTKSLDKAFFLFEMFADPTMLHAYTARIVLSKFTVITSSAERAKELAMEIYESDGCTQLANGLLVEYVEVEDVGPSLLSETEVELKYTSSSISRDAEWKYLKQFVRESSFHEKLARDQLRSLWTAYCFHHELIVDTSGYDNDVNCGHPINLWWDNYEAFDFFMCKEMV